MTLGPRTTFTPHHGDPLTDREIEVLHCAAHGLGSHNTGIRLNLSVHTVKTHVRKVFVKLGAHDRSHMVALAFRHHYLWVGADNNLYAGRGGIPMRALLEAA